MKYFKFIILLLLPYIAFSQNDFKPVLKLNSGNNTVDILNIQNTIPVKSNNYIGLLDSLKDTKPSSNVKHSKKSPGLAFIYGLFVPGMGHLYANRFNSGKYFLISEAALWLSYAAFTIYGNWLLNDAYSYAETHAGITNSGKDKDDKFYVDIGNYNNIDEYNNEMLRFGEYDKLYLPENGYYFWWNSPEERRQYRGDKLAGDRTLNDRLFVIGAVLINHVVSAISAVIAANSYNNEISSKSSGGFRINAGVIKNYNRIDGIKLNIAKNF
ncbi:MAG: hypothetical protein IT280_10215 [Ignavibacteria bacterium]|nr:hypothetical protein [Ignavibacteria bacterium]